MSSDVTNKLYLFHFPLSAKGLDDGKEELKSTLESTRSLTDLKISIIFDSENSPEKLFSVVYERKLLGSLTFTGVRDSYKTLITEIFAELGLTINSTEANSGEVTKTPQGGSIINGDSTTVIGVRVDLKSLRRLFPGLSDAELLAMFGNKK